MLRIDQLKLPIMRPEEQDAQLQQKILHLLRIPSDQLVEWRIVRRSLDARRGHEPQYVYVLDIVLKHEKKLRMPRGIHRQEPSKTLVFPQVGENLQKHPRPVVVGLGPAGMFCALMLARCGLKPLIIERGQPVEERSRTVEHFWNTGELHPSSNVQFGEGGAGTFSDGKLNTLIKDKEQIGQLVLREMVRAGAPEEILYVNKPHIGTDRLKQMVRHIREEILSLGGEIRFSTALKDLKVSETGALSGVYLCSGEDYEFVEASAVFLAIGHSARDTFSMLHNCGIPMEPKAFAMGLRVEHLQTWINEARYHEYADRLGVADYKVTHTASNGRGVYSFCMCPGGYVVSSASEEGGLVTNGMSNYAREGRNANSALIVTITPEDYASYAREDGPELAGMHFQRHFEQQAFALGGGRWQAPVQRVGDFHKRRCSTGLGQVSPTFTGGYVLADLHEILPEYMGQAIDEGLRQFGKQIQNFDHEDALLTGVESRTSSPVRILRSPQTGMSVVTGLYPVGEGAGYAGGIMSAAIDGVKAAHKYVSGLV